MSLPEEEDEEYMGNWTIAKANLKVQNVQRSARQSPEWWNTGSAVQCINAGTRCEWRWVCHSHMWRKLNMEMGTGKLCPSIRIPGHHVTTTDGITSWISIILIAGLSFDLARKGRTEWVRNRKPKKWRTRRVRRSVGDSFRSNANNNINNKNGTIRTRAVLPCSTCQLKE